MSLITFEEFLATANLDNQAALDAAKVFEVPSENLIEATTINGLISDLKLSVVVKQISETPNHPAQNDMLSLIYALQGNHLFNFIQGTYAGDKRIAVLERLINQDMVEYKPDLITFRDTVLFIANKPFKPFADKTLHDVLIIRDQCPQITPDIVGNYAIIDVKQDVPEKHNPRLMAQNPRTDKWQRINSFYNVKEFGKYDARIPPEFNGWQLTVDNAYGVL